MDVDIIAVTNLTRLDARLERSVVGDKKVADLHMDMLVARILGKIVC